MFNALKKSIRRRSQKRGNIIKRKGISNLYLGYVFFFSLFKMLELAHLKVLN